MAKRRKETSEEEDTGFKLPKFDEEAFLIRERRNIKSTFISFLFGCLMALVCFGFWALMGSGVSLRWELVLLVCVADAVFLRSIFLKFKIDITGFKRRNWLGSFVTYFFTWFIVLIVLVNPPFYDDESPRMSVVVLPEMQEFGGPVEIVAKITDNSGLQKSDITLTIDGAVVNPDDYNYTSDIFSYTYLNNNLTDEKTYNFTLSAKDSHDNKVDYHGTFTYSNNTIFIPDPLDVNTPPGPRVGSATSIKFKVNADVTRLYYTIDNGSPINVTQKEGEFYISYPKYNGWPKNKNVTMQVYAEENYSFDVVVDKSPSQMNSDEIKNFLEKINVSSFGVKIIDNQTYYFQVADETGVGTEAPPAADLPRVGIITVPGFEILLFLAALVFVVLIFKYRKKDRQK